MQKTKKMEIGLEKTKFEYYHSRGYVFAILGLSISVSLAFIGIPDDQFLWKVAIGLLGIFLIVAFFCHSIGEKRNYKKVIEEYSRILKEK